MTAPNTGVFNGTPHESLQSMLREDYKPFSVLDVFQSRVSITNSSDFWREQEGLVQCLQFECTTGVYVAYDGKGNLKIGYAWPQLGNLIQQGKRVEQRVSDFNALSEIPLEALSQLPQGTFEDFSNDLELSLDTYAGLPGFSFSSTDYAEFGKWSNKREQLYSNPLFVSLISAGSSHMDDAQIREVAPSIAFSYLDLFGKDESLRYQMHLTNPDKIPLPILRLVKVLPKEQIGDPSRVSLVISTHVYCNNRMVARKQE